MQEKLGARDQEWLLTSAEILKQAQRILQDYLGELSSSTDVQAAVSKAFLDYPSGDEVNFLDREIRFRRQFNLWGLKYVVKPGCDKSTDIVVKLSLTRRGDKEAYITREEREEVSIEFLQGSEGNIIKANIMHKNCTRNSQIGSNKYTYQEEVTKNTNGVITLADEFLNQFRIDVPPKFLKS